MIGRHSACRVLLLCLGTLLSASGCEDLAEPTVLTVGSRDFTARDLRALHAAIDPSQRPSLSSPDERIRFVDRVVERTLLAEYGTGLVAAEGFDAEGALDRIRDDALIRRLRALEGSDAALDTATVRQAYERMSMSHHIQGLLFARESEALIAKERLGAGQLRDLPEFSTGASFDSWVSWSPVPDPVTDLVGEAEIGDVVGPIPSRSWWRLVQVVDRRPEELEPYENLRPRILRGLRLRAELGGSRSVLGPLLEQSGLQVHEDAIDRLADQTRRAILRPGATENEPGWAVPDLAKGPDFIVAEWTGGSLRAWEYATLINGLSRGQRPRSAGLTVAIRAVVNDYADRQLLLAEAKRRGLESDPWVERLIGTQRTDRLIQWAMADLERAADAGVVVDSLVLALRESQAHLFYQPARARVLRFDLPSRAAAESELAAVRAAGGALARLEQRLSSETPTVGGYHLMRLARDGVTAPGLETAVFDAPTGTVSGPYELVGTWAIITCLEIESERELSDAEVTAMLGRRQSASDVVQEWIQIRSAEVGVTVDEGGLADLRPGG